MNLIKIIILCLLPVISWAQEAKYSIGQLADSLMGPVNVVGDFVNGGCFVLGVAFLFIALIKYIEHKRSPLLVPISTVVFLVIAGIVLLLLPFVSVLIGSDMTFTLFK